MRLSDGITFEKLRQFLLEQVPPPARRPRVRAVFWWLADRFNRTRFYRAEIVLHDLGEKLGGKP